MEAINARACHFNEELRRLTKPSECSDLFRATISPYGIDTFACGELLLNDKDCAVFFILDWPESWRRFYHSSGMIHRDPIVEALVHRREPYTWNELRRDRKLSVAGRAAFELIAAEGWIDGLVVPLHGSGSRVGLVSLAGHCEISTTGKSHLSLISVCLHTHVRTLVAREGFALPPVGLTGREVACVRLVARGMTDGAIAKTLSIAVSTAHEFVEKAKRRLKVKSRAELIAVAVALGIVEI